MHTNPKNSSDIPDAPVSSSQLAAQESGLKEAKALADIGLPTQPQSIQQADLVDKLLADELAKLSFTERERATFDIHGMSHEGKDPDNIATLLQELETEIRSIHDKKAYERAKYLNEEYVTDRAFRLLFLRSDDFDVKMAAQRIVAHFETKKDLFGDGAILGRDVRMSDLSEDDMKALESGTWQLLPVRDAAGRLVMFHSPTLLNESVPNECLMRYVFYFMWVLIRIEDVQRNGMVVLSSWDGVLTSWKTASFLHHKLMHYRQGMPRKVAGIHYCTEHQYLRPLLAGICWFSPPHMRARLRTHFGDLEQLKFELQTFGIPTECVPMLSGDGLSLENHKQWIVSQQKREEEGGIKSDIIVPRRFDVLFGRGFHTQHHTGNRRAAHIADMFRDKYEAASKYEKTAIAERIVALIQESQGRFLKWEDDLWLEVDQQAARNKISHFYRNTRKKKDASNLSNTESCSDGSVSGGSTSADSDVESLVLCSKRSSPEPLIQSQPVQKRSQRAV